MRTALTRPRYPEWGKFLLRTRPKNPVPRVAFHSMRATASFLGVLGALAADLYNAKTSSPKFATCSAAASYPDSRLALGGAYYT